MQENIIVNYHNTDVVLVHKTELILYNILYNKKCLFLIKIYNNLYDFINRIYFRI